MKKFLFLLLLTITAIPIVHIITIVPGENDCMLTYVRQLDGVFSRERTGTVYVINGSPHIEFERPSALTAYETGTARGCLIKDQVPLRAAINTHYCVTAYVTNKLF